MSYALLIEDAVAEGFDADEDFSTAIIVGSNGFFVMLDHDEPAITHKIHEGLALPIQVVVFDKRSKRLNMTIDPPDANEAGIVH
jgi:hypothetical protein